MRKPEQRRRGALLPSPPLSRFLPYFLPNSLCHKPVLGGSGLVRWSVKRAVSLVCVARRSSSDLSKRCRKSSRSLSTCRKSSRKCSTVACNTLVSCGSPCGRLWFSFPVSGGFGGYTLKSSAGSIWYRPRLSLVAESLPLLIALARAVLVLPVSLAACPSVNKGSCLVKF